MINHSNTDNLISEIFAHFQSILTTAERHPTVRQSVIKGVCKQLRRTAKKDQNQSEAHSRLQVISGYLQPLLTHLTRDEIETIVEVITFVYLEQRKNIENDGNGEIQETEINGDRYKIWLKGKRPLTPIEGIILKWLGDTEHPIAQQVAMQAKIKFANALDQAEEKRIQEILKQRGLSTTRLEKPLAVQIRRFLFDTIVGILATLDLKPYRKIITKVLPETLHQDTSQHDAVDFVLRNWRSDANNNRKIATNVELGTTSHRLGLGLKLAKNPLLWAVPSSVVAVSALSTAIAGTGYVISNLPQSIPSPVPTSPPEINEPDKGIFVLRNASVKDMDSSNFDRGQLTVEFSSGATVDDRLWIHNQGNNQGKIGVDGKQITYGGEIIGQFEGGEGIQPLVVKFNEKSTPEAAQALLSEIQYTNVSQKPEIGKRELKFQISDGKENGVSQSLTKIINLTDKNQAPSVTLVGDNVSQTVKENSKLVIGGISINDQDSQNITVTLSVEGGILTVKPITVSNPDQKNPKTDVALKSTTKNKQATKSDATLGLKIKDNNTKQVVLTGTVVEINNILSDPNAITYKPDRDFSDGQDSLTITVNDNGKNIPGAKPEHLVWPEGSLSAETTTNKNVSITVTPAIPPVVINAIAEQTVNENTDLNLGGISISDPNNSSKLTATLQVDNGVMTVKNNVPNGLTTKEILVNGKKKLKLQGTLAQITTTLADSNAIVYRPNQNFSGQDTFNITVENGSKKASQSNANINVIHPNQPPVIAESLNVPEFQPLPPPENVGITQSESVKRVNEYLELKKDIFGSNYNYELAASILTGDAYESKVVSSEADSLKSLQQNNAFYQYGKSEATFVGNFDTTGDSAQIDVRIYQELAKYQNGSLVSPMKSHEQNYRVKLQKVNDIWKIAQIKPINGE